MQGLQVLITALTLLPSLSLAVAPVPVPPNGKAIGFISDLGQTYRKPTGDWLTSTLCFCHSPTRVTEDWRYEKAAIFQHEYYNYHSNATFVLDYKCLSRARIEGDQCIRPNLDDNNNGWYKENDNVVCKDFPRTEEEKIRQGHTKRMTKRGNRGPMDGTRWTCLFDCNLGPYAPETPQPASHRDHDKVCFKVGHEYFGTTEMDMTFNFQRRDSDHDGEQGRESYGWFDVKDFCDAKCKENFQMPMDNNTKDKQTKGGSRQYVYTAMDDMCDHCK